MPISSEDTFPYSNHARRRAQQRGKPRDALEVVWRATANVAPAGTDAP